MIAEEKKQAVLAAIQQTQDEAAFAKIAALVTELLSPAQRRAGFLQGSVVYHTPDWDAPLPDATWAHNAPPQ